MRVFCKREPGGFYTRTRVRGQTVGCDTRYTAKGGEKNALSLGTINTEASKSWVFRKYFWLGYIPAGRLNVLSMPRFDTDQLPFNLIEVAIATRLAIIDLIRNRT